MANSKEYPDLPWVQPRSWTNANRTSVQLIVIHTTEGSAHAGSAEDGAAYDARRTDGTSAHYFHDSTSTVQCVLTSDIAHTAKGQGNRRGIHHELCTRAGTADWSDLYHGSMLKQAARQCARDARKWGIQVRALSPNEVRNNVKGFCGHADISLAFGQSDHTDPGRNFPWGSFLGMVRTELQALDQQKDEDDMDDATIAKVAKATAEQVWRYDVDTAIVGTQSAAGYLTTENRRSAENRTQVEPEQSAAIELVSQRLDSLAGQVQSLERLLNDRLPAPTEPTDPPVAPTP